MGKETILKQYEELKRNKKIINAIEPDFFFEIVDYLLKENEELRFKLSLKQFDINVVYTDYLEKLNEYKEASISKQKIKSKIIELKENINKNNIERYLSEDVLEILQELLEEGEI